MMTATETTEWLKSINNDYSEPEKFKEGQKLLAGGYDMRCKYVIVEVTFVRYETTEHFDCVIFSDGVRSHSNSSKLYTDRKKLERDLINEIY